MKTRQELTEEINDKKIEIRIKEKEIINFEPDEDYFTEYYNDMLDECYEKVFDLYPSTILEKCDPIQYQCGLTDFIDSLEDEDKRRDPNYEELESELEELESELEELESELEELD